MIVSLSYSSTHFLDHLLIPFPLPPSGMRLFTHNSISILHINFIYIVTEYSTMIHKISYNYNKSLPIPRRTLPFHHHAKKQVQLSKKTIPRQLHFFEIICYITQHKCEPKIFFSSVIIVLSV